MSEPTQSKRERALGLCRELNSISLDLKTATGVLIDHHEGRRHGRFLTDDAVCLLVRMCSGWMALAFYRFDQLLDPFWDVIPDEQRQVCAVIRREIGRRRILEFRTSIVHPFDGKGGPLTLPTQVNERFRALGMGDMETWYRWICPWPEDIDRTPGVMGQLNAVRDSIALAHGITREELIESLEE